MFFHPEAWGTAIGYADLNSAKAKHDVDVVDITATVNKSHTNSGIRDSCAVVDYNCAVAGG